MHPLDALLRAIFVLSVLLNVVVLICVCKSRMKRSSWNDNPHLYVINMVVADLLLGIGGVGHMAFRDLISMESHKNEVLFKLLMSYGNYASLACAAFLTIDRAVAVIHPLRFRRWRAKRAALTCLVSCWLLSIIMLLVYFFTRGKIDKKTKFCSRIVISLFIFIGVSCTIGLNTTVLLVFRRRARLFPDLNAATKASMKSVEKSVLYTAFLMTNCVILCTIPYAVITALRCLVHEFANTLLLSINVVFHLKSVVNPMILFGGFLLARKKHRRRTNQCK